MICDELFPLLCRKVQVPLRFGLSDFLPLSAFLPDLSPFPLHAISPFFKSGLFLGIHSPREKIPQLTMFAHIYERRN